MSFNRWLMMIFFAQVSIGFAQMKEKTIRFDYLTEVTVGIGLNTLSMINLVDDTVRNNLKINPGPVYTLFAEFPVGKHCTVGPGYSYGRTKLSSGGSFAYLITQTIGARVLLHSKLDEPGIDFFFGFRPGYTIYTARQPTGTTSLSTGQDFTNLYLPGFILGGKFRLPGGFGFQIEGALFSNYLFQAGISYQF